MSERPYLRASLEQLLVGADAAPVAGVRVLLDDDLPAVAGLMADAYRGTVDDEGGDADDALDELRRAADGAYGTAIRGAWLLAEREGRPVSAIAVTEWRGHPFVAFVFTDPAEARRGLATGLLREAARVLANGGRSELTLMVTRANPALALYRRLGFVEAPVPAAG